MALEAALTGLARSATEGSTGTALPADCYLDEQFFRLEVERVLRPGWHAVARRDDLPEPGDYRAVDLFGEPLLLVRDAARNLRAFSRICLHRAHPIASGQGNARRIVCPYHRWSYDLDGRLASAPLMEDVPGFDRDACRLPELTVEEWQGFVLVSVDPRAERIGPQLGELDALLESIGLRDFKTVGVLDYDSPWNWKVMVENFMESYHHMGPHVDVLQPTHPAKGTHVLGRKGPFAVLENPAVGGEGPFWVIQVFPTLLLAQTRGETPICSWYEMQIDAHDHLHLRIHLLMGERDAANANLVEGVKTVFQVVHAQDIPVCEGVQRGLKSRLWQPGPLSHHERALQLFHRHLAERLAAA